MNESNTSASSFDEGAVSEPIVSLATSNMQKTFKKNLESSSRSSLENLSNNLTRRKGSLTDSRRGSTLSINKENKENEQDIDDDDFEHIQSSKKVE